MREYATPLTVDLPTSGSLTDDVVANSRDVPQQVVFSRRTAEGWTDVTAAEFHDLVRDVGKGFIAAGVGPGDRLAILSRTRFEWTVVDYAAWYVGAASVPIYETSSEEQIHWILSDSGARAIVVESSDHLGRVNAVRSDLTELRHTWSIDDNAVEVLSKLGADVSEEELEQRRASVTPASPATIIYTSGTTGVPKGCLLSHGNFMTELNVAVHDLDDLFADGAATLLTLPLAHVFARIIQIGAVKARVRLGHSSGVRNLVADLQSFRPTFVLGVPSVFEKIYNTASLRAASDGRGTIFDQATSTAIAFSRAQDKGRVGPVLKARHAFFDRLVYRQLRDLLGGSCAFAISGGAPLGERLAHFWRGVGLTVLEGYGLTETAAAVTTNLPSANKIGTVGRPLQGVTVRIAEDGELLVRGGQVMSGYWRDPEGTTAVLHNGWLHTGDIGEIDDEGFVRITGRKKEILVTAGGKNVSPAVLEDRVRAHQLIDQCMVVGDGQPFVAALVTLDPEAFETWRDQHGRKGGLQGLLHDPELVAEIQSAVDEANKAVSQAEAIRRFAILPSTWTEDGGQLTPSLKLKRNVVMRQFRAEVDALFDP
ncbi:MAG TPA: AMP-dependent synthetase/ligase [Nocardioidaceae bacterium]|nr:AMP-dependent synthetase/ligase [Nocardioidaceae bacterium]